MELTASAITAPLTKFKFPLQVLAFMYGASKKDLDYIPDADLKVKLKVLIAATAGRTVGLKLFNYGYPATFDIGRFFGTAFWAWLGITAAENFVDGSEINAIAKLKPFLLAYSAGQVFDPDVTEMPGGASNPRPGNVMSAYNYTGRMT